MFRLKNNIKTLGGKCFEEILPSYPGLKNIKIILLYHRVVTETPKGLYDPSLFVTGNTFEMHINEIKQLFEIVPLENIIQLGGREGRLCAITFDDGWIDNYEVAFPIIKKYQIPITIFISPETIGSNHFFWPQSLWSLANRVVANGGEPVFINYFHDLIPTWNPPVLSIHHLSALNAALKSFPGNTLDDLIAGAYVKLNLAPTAQQATMDWDHASEMSKFGVSFGSHGLRHYILTTLDDNLKRKEIIESFEILKEKPLKVSRFFSYPNGDWDEGSIAFVSEAGYQGGVTTRLGYNTSKTNPFLLNRIGLHEYISYTSELFWFRIFQAIISGSGFRKSGLQNSFTLTN